MTKPDTIKITRTKTIDTHIVVPKADVIKCLAKGLDIEIPDSAILRAKVIEWDEDRIDELTIEFMTTE